MNYTGKCPWNIGDTKTFFANGIEYVATIIGIYKTIVKRDDDFMLGGITFEYSPKDVSLIPTIDMGVNITVNSNISSIYTPLPLDYGSSSYVFLQNDSQLELPNAEIAQYIKPVKRYYFGPDFKEFSATSFTYDGIITNDVNVKVTERISKIFIPLAEEYGYGDYGTKLDKSKINIFDYYMPKYSEIVLSEKDYKKGKYYIQSNNSISGYERDYRDFQTNTTYYEKIINEHAIKNFEGYYVTSSLAKRTIEGSFNERCSDYNVLINASNGEENINHSFSCTTLLPYFPCFTI